MKRVGLLAFGIVGIALNACGAGSAEIVNNELILDVPEGETITYSTQLAASITKVIKTGLGTAVVTNDANGTFTGTTEVREGILEAQSNKLGVIPTLGDDNANTITVSDGAQLRLRFPTGPNQATKHLNNRFIIAGYGPDGNGAVCYLRAWQSATGHCDALMSDVTLTGDTLVTGDKGRIGIGGAAVDLGGYTLDIYPKGVTGFMLNGGTWTNGHMRFSGNMNPVFQNSNQLLGGPDNTFTLMNTATLGFWNAPTTFDWSLIAHGGTSISLGAGSSDNNNNIAGPITLADGTVNLTTYMSTVGMRQHLKGKISGAGKLRKYNNHFVFLDNAENDWSGGLQVNGESGGALVAKYPTSIPAASAVTLTTGVLAYDPANWTDDDVKSLAERAVYNGASGGFIAPYGNATLDATFTAPVQIGAANGATLDFTGKLVNDSVLRNNGGTLNVTGDNDGVELASIQLPGGTTTLDGTGYLDLGNRECKFGGANNSASAVVIVKNGSAIARTLPEPNKSTAAINVSDTGSKGVVLKALSGGTITNKVLIAIADNSRGAMYVDGGDVYNLCCASNDGYIGGGWNTYGFTGVYGGKYQTRGWLGIAANPGAFGVFEQTGGTVTIGQGFCPSRGGTARVRLSGGVFTGNETIRMGEQQWGARDATDKNAVLTIDGTADVKIAHLWITERTNTFTSIVNLNGGLLTASSIRKSDWNSAKRAADSKAYVNFNGGTFKGTSNASTAGQYFEIFGWGAQINCDEVHIFENGATIDTNGKDISNGSIPLKAPTGKGVASIALPSAVTSSTQIGPPVINITGEGKGATAWCEFDRATGKVGPVVITSPGWGYVEGTTTATIRLGDRTTNITCNVSLTDNVTTGGLTVRGGGRFQIKGENTYGGATVVSNATLVLGSTGAIPSDSDLHLDNGTLDLANKSQTVKSIGGTGVVKNGVTLTITEALKFDAATAQDKATQIDFRSPVVLPEGGIEITNIEALDRNAQSGVLCTFATPLVNPPTVNLPLPWRAYLSNGGRTLKFGYLHATMLIVR